MTWKRFRLFVNTFSADDQYSLLSGDNLLEPIQMDLSHKQKTFSGFFLAFFNSTTNFENSQKKDDPHSLYISKITDSQIRG